MKKLYFWLTAILGLISINLQGQLVNKSPRVLVIAHETEFWGGMETHVLSLQKALVRFGINSKVLTSAQTKLATGLQNAKLPTFKLYDADCSDKRKVDFIRNFCVTHKINVIITNSERDLPLAIKATEGLAIKNIFFYHMHPRHKAMKKYAKVLKKTDAIVVISKPNLDMFNDLNRKLKLRLKHICLIPPFFDDEKFFLFRNSVQTRQDFFRQAFNIPDIINAPLLCMIANIYKDGRKNHKMLLSALHRLIYERNKNVQAVFVGHGDGLEDLKKFAQQLQLEKHTFFLGLSHQTPNILHHSDIHVLPSNKEGFGLVHVEAALMHKPSIGAHGTGADEIILHGTTGLLFKNNNLDSLTDSIDVLISNPTTSQAMGHEAYAHAIKHFSTDAKMKMIIELLDMVQV